MVGLVFKVSREARESMGSGFGVGRDSESHTKKKRSFLFALSSISSLPKLEDETFHSWGGEPNHVSY